MKCGFVAKHRGIWPVRWLCEALGVSRNGFHAWLIPPPSARTRSDEVLAPKIRASFVGSDRTYGARRVWRDLLADGADCGLHRLERLMRAQALRARPRRRGLPVDRGEREGRGVDERSGPAVLGERTEPEVDRRLHLHLDGRGMAVCGGGDRPVLASRRRLVNARHHGSRTGHRRIADGDLAAGPAGCPAASFRPGVPTRVQPVVATVV